MVTCKHANRCSGEAGAVRAPKATSQSLWTSTAATARCSFRNITGSPGAEWAASSASCRIWVAAKLAAHPAIRLPTRPEAEAYVGSSIQFRLPGITTENAQTLVARLSGAGVDVKWFGAPHPIGFTSDHHSWRYVAAQNLPQTDRILAGLFDMRLPLTFTLPDCALLADLIVDAVAALQTRAIS